MPLFNVPRVRGDGPQDRCDTMTQMLEKPVLGEAEDRLSLPCGEASLRVALAPGIGQCKRLTSSYHLVLTMFRRFLRSDISKKDDKMTGRFVVACYRV
jgi:hypothetical protein